MIPILQPLIGVGNIYFGDSIDKVISNWDFVHLKKEEGYQSDMFLVEDLAMSFSTNEFGVIIDITCDEECIYKGKNLIGMTIETFINHTGEMYIGEIDELDFQEGEPPQYVYDFDSLGLLVWVKEGLIVTIIASNR